MRFLNRYPFRWTRIILLTLLLGTLIFYEATGGIRIETDILASLPRHDPVLANAYRVIRHLPIQDRLVIDIGISGGDRDALVAAGEAFESGLRESRLFAEIGTDRMGALFPELMAQVDGSLPLLFGRNDLQAEVVPLLSPESVQKALREALRTLQGLEGIGQASLVARDPLGLRNKIMARMASLMPGKETQLYRGKLLSRDGQHLLVIAKLAGSATDTAYTRSIPPLIEALSARINGTAKDRGFCFAVTAVGAYRAALDNENKARRGMGVAIGLTTLGIALLLLFTFPRPLVGLLALIPSTVGASLGLLICSWLFPSLSILAVSFGGAILAFTVDLGITYLMFLDRPTAVSGAEAAREVHAGGALAALTTIGGFSLLLLSDFRVMAEIGLFAALGVAGAYLCVHWLFPRLFTVMPPSLKPRTLWLGRVLDGIVLSAHGGKLIAVTLFFLFMLFFAQPEFRVNVNAMNALSPETIAAEEALQRVWGDLTSRVYVMVEGKDMAELQACADRLAPLLEEDRRHDRIRSAFTLGDLFPGQALAQKRAADWQAFWDRDRVAALSATLEKEGRALGFAPGAFTPFLSSLTGPPPKTTLIPKSFDALLGIARETDRVVQVSLVTPGSAYDALAFFNRYAATGQAALFDAGLFNKRLGETLVDLFTEIALITGAGITLVIFLYFLSWRQTLVVLAPVLFALVCTLGSLRLLGQPIDIPGIILWIVIMGMGIDYGIYYLCAYQRHLNERHPAMTLIRQAMFLSGTTTLIGFGILSLAEHPVLKSIGLTSLLGIAYSLAGAFLIVPPLTRWVFPSAALPPEVLEGGSPQHRRRVQWRYRHVETTPRLFAYWKLRLDPMFPRLADFLERPRLIFDVGCGYGVPATWLLELHPEARLLGIDPDPERVRIASHAWGVQGEARVGWAPELSALPDGADHALMLDIIHMLDDAAWEQTLAYLYDKLRPGGRLILRATVPRKGPPPLLRRIELARLSRWHITPHYREREVLEEQLQRAGFTVLLVEPVATDREELWLIGRREGALALPRRSPF